MYTLLGTQDAQSGYLISHRWVMPCQWSCTLKNMEHEGQTRQKSTLDFHKAHAPFLYHSVFTQQLALVMLENTNIQHVLLKKDSADLTFLHDNQSDISGTQSLNNCETPRHSNPNRVQQLIHQNRRFQYLGIIHDCQLNFTEWRQTPATFFGALVFSVITLVTKGCRINSWKFLVGIPSIHIGQKVTMSSPCSKNILGSIDWSKLVHSVPLIQSYTTCFMHDCPVNGIWYFSRYMFWTLKLLCYITHL